MSILTILLVYLVATRGSGLSSELSGTSDCSLELHTFFSKMAPCLAVSCDVQVHYIVTEDAVVNLQPPIAYFNSYKIIIVLISNGSGKEKLWPFIRFFIKIRHTDSRSESF